MFSLFHLAATKDLPKLVFPPNTPVLLSLVGSVYY